MGVEKRASVCVCGGQPLDTATHLITDYSIFNIQYSICKAQFGLGGVADATEKDWHYSQPTPEPTPTLTKCLLHTRAHGIAQIGRY